ncbi:MAG: DUF362 domain-containing protein [Bacillota bacterium]
MKSKVVAITRTNPRPDSGQISQAVRNALSLLGDLSDIIAPGRLVLIKPNLVAVPGGINSGAVTNPDVCRALADFVREMGARPAIAEASAAGVDTEKVIQATGYDRLREQGYEVIDLKKTPQVSLQIPGGRLITGVKTFEPVVKADAIISVPVLKTHDQTEATLSLKNLKGLITDQMKKDFHSTGVFDCVVDLASAVKPVLAVVDGIYGQEGLGPIFGKTVEMDLIVAGRDLVAVDTVCGAIMGFEPGELLLSVKAAGRGLGTNDLSQISVVGKTIEEVRRRFLRASEDAIVEVEGFNLIFEEGACTGCRNTVLSSIVDIKNDGNLDLLRGKTVIAGPIEEAKLPKGVLPENLVLVGKCTRHLAALGKHAKGCPPNNIWVVQSIVGDKAKRRYATEEIKD